jgi:hypothetical protein
MHYNQISFPNLRPLTFLSDLITKADQYRYLALIQYDDIIDYYQLIDISKGTLNQFGYYLYIAYDIRSFDTDNIKIIRIDQGIDTDQSMILDTMNANNSLLVYDQSMNDPSKGY